MSIFISAFLSLSSCSTWATVTPSGTFCLPGPPAVPHWKVSLDGLALEYRSRVSPSESLFLFNQNHSHYILIPCSLD